MGMSTKKKKKQKKKAGARVRLRRAPWGGGDRHRDSCRWRRRLLDHRLRAHSSRCCCSCCLYPLLLMYPVLLLVNRCRWLSEVRQPADGGRGRGGGVEL